MFYKDALEKSADNFAFFRGIFVHIVAIYRQNVL